MLTIIDANIEGYIVLFKSLVPLLIYAYFAPRGQTFLQHFYPFSISTYSGRLRTARLCFYSFPLGGST